MAEGVAYETLPMVGHDFHQEIHQNPLQGCAVLVMPLYDNI